MNETDRPEEVDLRDLIEHMREGLQVIGPDYRYLYVNRVAAEHGRSTQEALIGRTMMECYPGIEHTDVFERITRVLDQGGAETLENEFTFPDGSTGHFELRIARVPQGILLFSLDINERKSLEARALRAQRMDAIGQLAGGVAHDFNNLLTVIQAYAAFIREDLPELNPMRADIDCVLEASNRAAELTAKLLTFARQLPVAARSLPVEPAIRAVGQMLSRTLGTSVVLELDLAGSLGDVTMDPTAFDQVLVNLVVNARDAIEGSGTITIEASRLELDEGWTASRGAELRPGEYVLVAVSDTGSGIAPELLDRIFEPFFTTKDTSGGTGLGLATSWGLVNQAGGALTVYSEVGVGTTFRVYLPLARGVVANVSRPTVVSTAGRGELVLVVEDQDLVRELIARILREAGYRVLEVANATEAMTAIEDLGERIDLVLTDMIMPRMSGLELVDRLRRRYPVIKVLLVSGFAPRALAQRGLDPGALPMFAKPFTPAALLRAVREALETVREL